MSIEVRLKTKIVIDAELRRSNGMGCSAVVLHKGDDERGLILIKQYVYNQGARLYAQTRDLDDNLIWHQPLGQDFMDEQKADQYITRQRNFDEDLWVIEVDDPKGAYSPD